MLNCETKIEYVDLLRIFRNYLFLFLWGTLRVFFYNLFPALCLSLNRTHTQKNTNKIKHTQTHTHKQRKSPRHIPPSPSHNKTYANKNLAKLLSYLPPRAGVAHKHRLP